MFFKKPRGKTLDDIYNWCCETTEMLNRNKNTNDKETDNGNDIHDQKRRHTV